MTDANTPPPTIIAGAPPLVNGLVNTALQDAVGWAGSFLVAHGMAASMKGNFVEDGVGLLTILVAFAWGQIRETVHRANTVAAANAPAANPPLK